MAHEKGRWNELQHSNINAIKAAFSGPKDFPQEADFISKTFNLQRTNGQLPLQGCKLHYSLSRSIKAGQTETANPNDKILSVTTSVKIADGSEVGQSILTFYKEESTDVPIRVSLNHLITYEEYQGLGVGRSLLEIYEDCVRRAAEFSVDLKGKQMRLVVSDRAKGRRGKERDNWTSDVVNDLPGFYPAGIEERTYEKIIQT